MEHSKYYSLADTARKACLRAFAEAHQYQSWTNEFRDQNTRSVVWSTKAYICSVNGGASGYEMNRYYPDARLLSFIEPEHLLGSPDCLEKDELVDLGFGSWDGSLYLIPLWLVPFLNPDIEVESIDGKKERLGDVDNDNRFGCIAAGVRVKPHSEG